MKKTVKKKVSDYKGLWWLAEEIMEEYVSVDKKKDKK